MSWTIKTLKKYFDMRLKSLAKALKIARELMNSRLKRMNHIHQQLVKQNKTFVKIDRYEGDMRAVNIKIDAIKECLDENRGGSAVWPYIISIVSLIGVSVMILLNVINKG